MAVGVVIEDDPRVQEAAGVKQILRGQKRTENQECRAISEAGTSYCAVMGVSAFRVMCLMTVRWGKTLEEGLKYVKKNAGIMSGNVSGNQKQFNQLGEPRK